MISRKLLRIALIPAEIGKQSKMLRMALIRVTYPPSNRSDSILFMQTVLKRPAMEE